MSKQKEEIKQIIEPIKYLIDFDFDTYYDYKKLMSYTPSYNMFIVVGGRGRGKSTSLKKILIDDYLNNDNQFLLIRRWKDEITASKNYFNDIASGITIKSSGVKGAFYFMDVYNNKTMGYGTALAIQHKLKSGFDFSKVRNIVFEEPFIKPTATRRYIDDECIEFLELISTIVRTRKNYRIFLIGNNLDYFNPYYEFFKIPLFTGKYIDKKRGLYVEELQPNPLLVNKEKETPLYKLIQGTDYANYHYDNKKLGVKDTKIQVKNKSADLFTRLVFNECTLNLYYYNQLDLYIEFKDKVIQDRSCFILFKDNKPNYNHIKAFKTTRYASYVFKCYGDDSCYYNNIKASDLFTRLMEVFKQ